MIREEIYFYLQKMPNISLLCLIILMRGLKFCHDLQNIVSWQNESESTACENMHHSLNLSNWGQGVSSEKYGRSSHWHIGQT